MNDVTLIRISFLMITLYLFDNAVKYLMQHVYAMGFNDALNLRASHGKETLELVKDSK